MKKFKKYKALMLDLDGTTIPNFTDSMPSKRVISAINEARKVIQVSAATARRYAHMTHIIGALGLTGPSIVSGGAEIRDSKTGDILWSKPISTKTTKGIIEIFEAEKFPIWIDGNDYYYDNTLYDPGYPPRETLQISIVDVPLSVSDSYIKLLNKFNDIAVLKSISWKTPGKVWLSITHNEASKQHGVFEVAKILGIETHEMIGVGDGYNDFPLLMACGLKVAMGNAVDELKEIADYIAPSVDDDGVADVIERFVLNKKG